MIEHLSYSSISRYLRCGQQWKHKYVLDTPVQGKSANLLFGSAIHKEIQQSLAGDDSIGDTWRDSFDEQFAIESEIDYGKNSKESLFNLGVEFMANGNLHGALMDMQDIGIVENGIERRVSTFAPNIPIPTIGYIDILQKNGVPIDIKTSSKSWSQQRADSELQPSFYIAGLAQEGLVSLPGKFTYIILVKTKKPRVQVIHTWRDGKDVMRIINLIQQVWHGISSEVFVPNPTTWACSQNYCDFWNVCQGGLNAR